MLPVSICIIMKNEEKHLEQCLSSIQKHLPQNSYELILVDTGSTDNTMHIASRYTNQLYHFQWCNDFSAARNYSLQCATHDWVLVLDCDEFIENLDITCFDQMIQQYPHGIGMISLQNHYTQAGIDRIYTDEAERFFNRRFFHYEGRIHEQVRPIALNQKVKRISLPITATHSGYAGTPEELTAKAYRCFSKIPMIHIFIFSLVNHFMFFTILKKHAIIMERDLNLMSIPRQNMSS